MNRDRVAYETRAPTWASRKASDDLATTDQESNLASIVMSDNANRATRRIEVYTSPEQASMLERPHTPLVTHASLGLEFVEGLLQVTG